jgi:hypothetical protein
MTAMNSITKIANFELSYRRYDNCLLKGGAK